MAMEPLDAIRAQLQEQDAALTASLEELEHDREIVRRQLALVQELAELQEQRVAPRSRLEKTAGAEPATEPQSIVDAEPEHAVADAESAAEAVAGPVAEAVAEAETEHLDVVPEPAPVQQDEPEPTPLTRTPWPRAAGDPDTGLLRRMRAG
jgi:hypothetical protein